MSIIKFAEWAKINLSQNTFASLVANLFGQSVA